MERNRGGRPRHPDILTPAEWRVLEELRKGGTNAEIAVRLGVSPDAVKYHISNMLGKLALHDRHQLAAWQAAAKRGRLRALLATPVGFVSLTRPLVWAGVGAVTLAGVAALAVILVILQGNREPEPIALPPTPPTETPPPSVRGTPTSQCAKPATGEEPRLQENNGPGTYRVGEYRIVIPEGMELAAYEGESETKAVSGLDVWESQVSFYHYQIKPGGLQVVVEVERREYYERRTTAPSVIVTKELVDSSGEYVRAIQRHCRCPGQYLSPDLRVLVTIYCHVKGESFEHPVKGEE